MPLHPLRLEAFKRGFFQCHQCGRTPLEANLIIYSSKKPRSDTELYFRCKNFCSVCCKETYPNFENDFLLKTIQEFEQLEERLEQIEEYVRWRKEIVENSYIFAKEISNRISKAFAIKDFTDDEVKSVLELIKEFGVVRFYEKILKKSEEIVLSEYSDPIAVITKKLKESKGK